MAEATIRYAYFNPKSKGYLGSIRRVYEVAKKLKPKEVTYEKVREFLNRQNVYTLHKPVKRKFARNRTVALGKDTDFQADLIDVSRIARYNNGNKYILSVIDVLSKFAWAIPVKNKTAEEVIKGFKKVLKSGRKPWRLYTDAGGEFVNRKFEKFLEENDILKLTARNKETKAAVAERFNRSLKEKLWRYFTQRQTFKYLKILPVIVKNLNGSYNRTIKMSPEDVNEANELQVWKRVYGTIFRGKPGKFKFKVGDKVRVAKAKEAFEKGYRPNFSREVFAVSERLARQPPVYRINDANGETIIGVFYENELVKYE